MKLLQIIILFFLSSQAFGQKVTYNHIVDTADIETKKVMMLFENYLDSSPQNKGKNELIYFVLSSIIYGNFYVHL